MMTSWWLQDDLESIKQAFWEHSEDIQKILNLRALREGKEKSEPKILRLVKKISHYAVYDGTGPKLQGAHVLANCNSHFENEKGA